MSFVGKVVLITGAGNGIGAACAKHFATEKALLALVDLNADNLKESAEKYQEIGLKVKPLLIFANINADSERIVTETINKFGRLDVLINNAGIAKMANFANTTEADYDELMATNVRGGFFLTQLAIPHLVKTKGNVVNVSSISGLIPSPNLTTYGMTKAAFNHFTRYTALEFARKGVRVNAVCPGIVNTNFLKIHGNGEVEKSGKRHPIGRVAEPEEIAHAIAFLADEKSAFITGVTLPVDGGIQLTSA